MLARNSSWAQFSPVQERRYLPACVRARTTRQTPWPRGGGPRVAQTSISIHRKPSLLWCVSCWISARAFSLQQKPRRTGLRAKPGRKRSHKEFQVFLAFGEIRAQEPSLPPKMNRGLAAIYRIFNCIGPYVNFFAHSWICLSVVIPRLALGSTRTMQENVHLAELLFLPCTCKPLSCPSLRKNLLMFLGSVFSWVSNMYIISCNRILFPLQLSCTYPFSPLSLARLFGLCIASNLQCQQFSVGFCSRFVKSLHLVDLTLAELYRVVHCTFFKLNVCTIKFSNLLKIIKYITFRLNLQKQPVSVKVSTGLVTVWYLAAREFLILTQSWKKNVSIRSQIIIILWIECKNSAQIQLFFNVFLCCAESEAESASEIDYSSELERHAQTRFFKTSMLPKDGKMF